MASAPPCAAHQRAVPVISPGPLVPVADFGPLDRIEGWAATAVITALAALTRLMSLGSPTDAGTLGALMLVGGVLGAVIIPPFSDRQHRRKPYILLGLLLAIPGLIGVTFAADRWLIFVSAFEMGFFLVSINPIGMQYAAEITHPTPEGTSNGLIQLFGQASVVFVYIMEALKTADGSFTPALLLALGLVVVSALLVTQIQEPGSQPAPEALPAGD